jgi:hypothetical protein
VTDAGLITLIIGVAVSLILIVIGTSSRGRSSYNGSAEPGKINNRCAPISSAQFRNLTKESTTSKAVGAPPGQLDPKNGVCQTR